MSINSPKTTVFFTRSEKYFYNKAASLCFYSKPLEFCGKLATIGQAYVYFVLKTRSGSILSHHHIILLSCLKFQQCQQCCFESFSIHIVIFFSSIECVYRQMLPIFYLFVC